MINITTTTWEGGLPAAHGLPVWNSHRRYCAEHGHGHVPAEWGWDSSKVCPRCGDTLR